MATPAFACHNGTPHGKSTGCDGGGGGGTGPVPGGPTMAAFIGPAVLDEDNARACTPAPAGLTEGAGQFNCSLAEPVRITTAGMNLQARAKSVSLCKSLQFFGTVPNMTPIVYQYGWTDSCGDGACQIVVDISLSGAAISAASGGKADAVDLRVSGTLSGEALGGNPFQSHLNIRELTMSQVNMQFRKPGSTTVAAVCDWYPASTDPEHAQSVSFTSLALPPSP